jgi:hypothetical protein
MHVSAIFAKRKARDCARSHRSEAARNMLEWRKLREASRSPGQGADAVKV